MALRVYNTLTRQQEHFQPWEHGHVRLYGCGPTVYNYPHLGNLRAYVFQDTVRRTLHFLGYRVTYVMNITDVGHLESDADSGEDKLVRSAQAHGHSVLQVAAHYRAAFFRDTALLGIEEPSIVCNASDCIQDMIAFIEQLLARGHAYCAGGNVYFDVRSFPSYESFGSAAVEDVQEGEDAARARVAHDTHKRDARDFVLWFTRSKFVRHALTWDSPWGRGYPGWHIGCSAMSMKFLGPRCDIHIGGVDHIRVHHRNERAQCEAITGAPWVRYWLHHEFLLMQLQKRAVHADMGSSVVSSFSKMSKSCGQFLTLSSLQERGFQPADFRFFLLSGQYRTQLAFSWDALKTARAARRSFVRRVARVVDAARATTGSVRGTSAECAAERVCESRASESELLLTDFRAALEDDFSTPRALSALQKLVRDTSMPPSLCVSALQVADTVLGLGIIQEATASLSAQVPAGDTLPQRPLPSEEWIGQLVRARAHARQTRDFPRADEIRRQLKAEGIELEDTHLGTIWKRV
ncbi:cysteine--tRNA ligase [Treponema pallidum]|nr:cysteine--tRNA ligase [Treponema pallidum]QUJ95094.1 cysteine--tRNA ligase [Treponema pallidum]QUJ96052.1 cysteine--tRNA ligase [Treponema pallidum]QUJ98944.1 cysteine--tRNA ligase [Treponema pallidum]QUK00874.1 cysteine--tRNA ligase [Treponema pallidum]